MSSRASDKRRARKKHKRAVERARATAAASQAVVLTEEDHIERHADAMRRRLKETQELILKLSNGSTLTKEETKK